MLLNVERMKANVRQAETEDLLDRITIFRGGMEEIALAYIEEELRRREIARLDIEAHEEMRRLNPILMRGGFPARCGKCFRPAVERVVDWHWVYGLIPLFWRSYYYCEQHRPRPKGERNESVSGDVPEY
jgi:hypothetical protein